MRLNEAIDYTKTRAEDLEFRGYNREAQGLQLCIEASEQYAQARRLGLPLRCELLPGETKE